MNAREINKAVSLAREQAAIGKEADRRVRFWTKVQLGNPDECWNWTGCCDSHGYGIFAYKRKCVRIYKLALLFTTGEIPKYICHHCDNRKCANPAHLYAGSHQENMADMKRRGRHRGSPIRAVGERCASAKLTTAEVLEIREAYLSGCRVADLARRYKVSHPSATRIVRRKSWKHI